MMSNNDFSLTTIEQIAVNVHDTERATAFYRDTLGMKFLFSAPPNLSFFDCDGVRLMLSPPTSPEFDHPASILYFKVSDIQSAHQTLVERGVSFIEKPTLIADMGTHNLWVAAFRDSENNTLGLMSNVAKES